MIEYKSVIIENIDFAAQGNKEIHQNLRTLYTTPEGSVPLDRKFGINVDLLDGPIPLTQGRAIVEYTEKTKRYEPRAVVKEVNFEVNHRSGNLIPKVVISVVNDS